ncbi:Endonuclease/exonuclease/phosphatase [Syncephalis plumigaleata]|nr:Endonuclease/exonuclease/phosphatase [Syncephalis plumigaleata]
MSSIARTPLLTIIPYVIGAAVSQPTDTQEDAEPAPSNQPDITYPTNSGEIGGFTPLEYNETRHIPINFSRLAKEPASTSQVRLAQYNFFMRPPGINSNGNDYKDERLNYFIKYELDRFDVIAFQEVFAFGSGRRSQLIKLAYANGYKYSVASPRYTGVSLRIDGGLVLISRYPVVRSAVKTFDRGVDSDWLSAKGVIYAKLDVGGKHVHVFSTHLQASYSLNYPMTDRAVQVRMKQLYDMRHFMDEQLRDEATSDPVIFAGDLNINGRPFDAVAADKGESSEEYGLAMSVLRGDGVEAKTIGVNQPGRIYTSPTKIDISDLLLDARHMHPETFGDVMRNADGTVQSDAAGKPIPMEKQLTDKDSLASRQRLDYILSIQRDQSTNAATAKRMQTSDTTVEHFFVDVTKEKLPVIQLSDHYGVSTKLAL